MRIWRDFDPTAINAILNHPEVRPDVAVADEGVIDLSFAVKNADNILLMGEHGGVFFIRLMGGVYECHTQCLPSGRGKWIYRFVKECGTWMYTRSDAFEITTRIPQHHQAARHLAVMAGMKMEFTRPQETVWRGQRQDVDIYSYRLQDWASHTSGAEERGHAFHDWLHSEAHRLGVTEPPHANDPQHNRYLGIALAMLEGGQVVKGVVWFNRWALLSRHAPIQLVSKDSVIRIRFDIGDFVVEKDGSRRVEKVEKMAA